MVAAHTVAARTVGITIMEVDRIVDITIIVEVAGMGLFGLDLDGVAGIPGGVLLTIHTIIHIIETIHTIRKHPRLSSNNLRYMSSQRNNIIGISAKIPRGTIHT